MKKYKITGLVYGNFWGGGEGLSEAKILITTNKKEIIKEANDRLKDGSLDAGMGYENLIGALLTLTTTTTTIIDDKIFTNEEYKNLFIGKLTSKQKNFLKSRSYEILIN